MFFSELHRSSLFLFFRQLLWQKCSTLESVVSLAMFSYSGMAHYVFFVFLDLNHSVAYHQMLNCFRGIQFFEIRTGPILATQILSNTAYGLDNIAKSIVTNFGPVSIQTIVYIKVNY